MSVTATPDLPEATDGAPLSHVARSAQQRLTEDVPPAVLHAGTEALYRPHPPPAAVHAEACSPGSFSWLEYDRYVVAMPWLRGAARFRQSQADDVLEVGCGIGFDLLSFARSGARVTGVDVDAGRCGVARRLLRYASLEGRILTGDARDIPVATASQDLVYLCDLPGALHELVQPDSALAEELARVLRPGGELRLIRSLNRDIPDDEATLNVRSERGEAPVDDHAELWAVARPEVVPTYYRAWRLVTQTWPTRLREAAPEQLTPLLRSVGRPVRWIVERPFVIGHSLREGVSPASDQLREAAPIQSVRRTVHRLRQEGARLRQDARGPRKTPSASETDLMMIARGRGRRARLLIQPGRPWARALLAASVAMIMLVTLPAIVATALAVRGARRIRLQVLRHQLTRRLRSGGHFELTAVDTTAAYVSLRITKNPQVRSSIGRT